MSYAYWAQHFGADPKVLGQNLDLNIGNYTVVGVLGPGQAYPEWVPGNHTEVYLPLAVVAYKQGDLHQRGNHADARTIARLKPGITLEQARDRLTLIAHRIAAAYPATDSGFSANLTPLSQEEVGNVRPALAVLVAAVALVFLLACANVANLALVRATARARELGVSCRAWRSLRADRPLPAHRECVARDHRERLALRSPWLASAPSSPYRPATSRAWMR